MQKKYISAQTLLDDSLTLGLQIVESGYQPDLIVGVWRGGTPVAIAVQEVLEFVGIKSDHIAIRTSSYTGINERSDVTVHGLEYLEQSLDQNSSVLIIDDIFDTGCSIEKVIHELTQRFQGQLPDIKVATPYFKPESNQTAHCPDFYLHEVDQWIVFPHELLGLSDHELLNEKLGIDSIKQRLLALKKV